MNTNPNISFNDTTKVTCDECGHEVFIQAFLMRKVSRILTGQPKDTYIPVPVFQCAKCGHINSEFLPKEQEGSEDQPDLSKLENPLKLI